MILREEGLVTYVFITLTKVNRTSIEIPHVENTRRKTRTEDTENSEGQRGKI